MFTSDFKHLYIGNSGLHEKGLLRDDGKRSDVYIRDIIIELPKIFSLRIKVFHWKIDDRIDIKTDDITSDKLLSELKGMTISLFPTKKVFESIFKLAYPDGVFFKSLTLKEITGSVNGNFNDYLKLKGIKIYKESTFEYSYEYFAIFTNYDHEQIVELFLISVVIPLLRRQKEKLQEVVQAVRESERVPFAVKFKEYAIFFSIVSILFLGFYTHLTKKRTGCICNDGTDSDATSSGACSHHYGVKRWVYQYWWDK